jgi:hypothetical protein
MAPAAAVEAWGQIAGRVAFRSAARQGALWAAVGVGVLVWAGGNETLVGLEEGISRWALVMVVMGALPTLLLVRRSKKALGLAGLVIAVEAAAVLAGDPGLAIAAAMAAIVGPSAVAAAIAWGPLRAGEAWARGATACTVMAVAAPLLLLTVAAAGGHGLPRDLANIGIAMGFEGAHPPGPPCIANCSARAPHVWMSSVAAPLGAALVASVFFDGGALIVTRSWRPKAVPEV